MKRPIVSGAPRRLGRDVGASQKWFAFLHRAPGASASVPVRPRSWRPIMVCIPPPRAGGVLARMPGSSYFSAPDFSANPLAERWRADEARSAGIQRLVVGSPLCDDRWDLMPDSRPVPKLTALCGADRSTAGSQRALAPDGVAASFHPRPTFVAHPELRCSSR